MQDVETPKCKTCGKPLLPNKRKIGKYCSHDCIKKDEELISDFKSNKKLRELERKYKVDKRILSLIFYDLGIIPLTRSTKTCNCGKPIFYKNANYCSRKCALNYSENLKKYIESIKKSSEELKIAKRLSNSRRRAAKRNAIDETANKKLLKLIYQHVPEGYEVDHIIPITKGGLHHENNLQYLSKSENSRKRDRLDYEPQGVIRWQDVININTDLTEN